LLNPKIQHVTPGFNSFSNTSNVVQEFRTGRDPVGREPPHHTGDQLVHERKLWEGWKQGHQEPPWIASIVIFIPVIHVSRE
jgi:hypothetical protein